jgi:hypothetical protein
MAHAWDSKGEGVLRPALSESPVCSSLEANCAARCGRAFLHTLPQFSEQPRSINDISK